MTHKTIHFIGIGGAGMSGIAQAFNSCGYTVKGSDIKKTKVTERLEKLGIKVSLSHSPENVESADYVVYSSCIKEDNPELRFAAKKNLHVLKRIEALNMLFKDKDIISVSGAHGKTTTSSLISYLLIKAGMDPSVFIGADVDFLKGNARCGHGDIVVTEADESDGSFLLLNQLYAVATNVDLEHMDYYLNMENVMKAYSEFIENTRPNGAVFLCSEDKKLLSLAKGSSRKIITYGFSPHSVLRADKAELMGPEGSSFGIVYKGENLGRVKISLAGRHNILNSLAAIAVALRIGVDFKVIKEYISEFGGVERRFVMTDLGSDILLVDDYAHHPTEIEATLNIMEGSGRRIVAVFQPHRYTRTKELSKEFGSCFNAAEHLVITDIYSAHEKPIEGVSARDICESARKQGHKNVHFVPKEDILNHLKETVRKGDAIFVMGAGDIDELPEKIIKEMTAG